MKRFITVLLFCLTNTLLFSQNNVEWADTVLSYSGLDFEMQYGVKQILGPPNVYPSSKMQAGAWLPFYEKDQADIKVGFKKAINVKQIVIAETHNPGAIQSIFLYDSLGNEYPVADFTPATINQKCRLLYVKIEETPYRVFALKLKINGADVEGLSAFDCIGVSNESKNIEVTPNISPIINPTLNTEKLSTTVNSKYREVNPILSPEGKTMYFSRTLYPGNTGGIKDREDIWFSEWDEQNQNWKEAKNVGSQLNNNGPNYISSISPNGESLTFLLGNIYKNEKKMKAGISISEFKDSLWSAPKKIEIPGIKNRAVSGHFFLSNDREIILLSINQATGEDLDVRNLYVSFNKNEKWTVPLNLGTINSDGNDGAPFLAADNKTLYYSSEGRSGYGKSDIFMTRRLDDSWTNWTEPENLGAKINSEYDDLFFSMPESGKHAYYCKEDATGNLDMYQIPLRKFYIPDSVVVKGNILISDTLDSIESLKIIYTRVSDGQIAGIAFPDSGGHYEISLEDDESYTYRIETNGLTSKEGVFDLTKKEESNEITKNRVITSVEEIKVSEINQDLSIATVGEDLVISDIDPDSLSEVIANTEVLKEKPGSSGFITQKIIINNLLFDFDKAILRSVSYQELDKALELLQANLSLKIEVIGYTDSSGPESYNLSLSKRRAKAVSTYLVSKGLSIDNILSTGYGESKPITSNATRSGRKKNRRVEILVKP